MNVKEKQQCKKIWADLENIVTVADPHLKLSEHFRPESLDREDLEGIGKLIDVIRIHTKYLLLVSESLERERDSFMKMLMEGKGNE